MQSKFINRYINENLNALKTWKEERREYIYAKNLFKDIPRTNTINKKIVFNTVRPAKSIFDREFYLGKLLALNGARVIMLLDDGIMGHTETFQINDIQDIRKFEKTVFNPHPYLYKNLSKIFTNILTRSSIKEALKTYADKNLEVIFYSKILKEINYKDWQALRKYAKSSTIRFFKTSVVDYNDRYVNYYYKLSLLNAILSRNIAEYVYSKLKPDLFITSHGIYSTWGPAFKYLFDRGINTLVYSSIHGHSLNSKEIYFSNTRTYFLSQSKYWQEFKKRDVTDEMKSSVRNYFKYRRNLNASDTKILYKGKLNSYKVNKDDGYKYHMALFPNVIWDGNITDRHKIFNNYLDWIISTIEHVKGRKDIKLYIKSHPSEISVLKKSPRFIDIIRKQISLNDAENIELITPEKRINTYEFLKSGIDLGIVYDGFLALEIPLLKITTIMCVKDGMFYAENGQITPESKEEYFNYLDNIEGVINKFKSNYQERYNNLVKYTYWYIYENAVNLPTLSKTEYIKTNLMQLKKDEIILDKNFLKLLELD